jgi:hypothetical protein
MKTKIKYLLPVLWAALLFNGCATPGNHSIAWDYKIVIGPVRSAVTPPGTLEEQIVRAAADGWEVSHVSMDPTHGPFAILRKPKN